MPLEHDRAAAIALVRVFIRLLRLGRALRPRDVGRRLIGCAAVVVLLHALSPKRSMPNGIRSTGGFVPPIRSAMHTAVIGVSRMPLRKCPVA